MIPNLMKIEYGFARNACISSAMQNFARIKKLLGDTFAWLLHVVRVSVAKATLNHLHPILSRGFNVTDKKCIGFGEFEGKCTNKAGTKWSPLSMSLNSIRKGE